MTTGVHQRADMERLQIYADHVIDDLRELITADIEE